MYFSIIHSWCVPEIDIFFISISWPMVQTERIKMWKKHGSCIDPERDTFLCELKVTLPTSNPKYNGWTARETETASLFVSSLLLIFSGFVFNWFDFFLCFLHMIWNKSCRKSFSSFLFPSLYFVFPSTIFCRRTVHKYRDSWVLYEILVVDSAWNKRGLDRQKCLDWKLILSDQQLVWELDLK